ncbi:MAG: alkyl sulfatase dimerization domain-containing protein [Oligoflexales bacterium]
MLNKQEKHFEQRVVKLSDHVYTAIGFHGANSTMIEGTDGVIIVDTLMGPESAQNALKAFRKYSNKPVKAIIYTHSHDDHTGGSNAFAEDYRPEIYAMENFFTTEHANPLLNKISLQRGARQFGRNLLAHEMTNRGVGPANTIDHDRGTGYLKPTILIGKYGKKVMISGVELEMHPCPGETDDALFVWLPKEKVLIAGDNFYRSFPNLYAIRGTPYRNVLLWSDSVSKMAEYSPNVLVPGHTSPIVGQKDATEALKNYSDAIQLIYKYTIDGINQGKSSEIIANEFSLPDHLQNKEYLIEFYGSVHHAIKAIYSGLMGWFEGNPSTLNPLTPEQESLKFAELAGGVDNLYHAMNRALEKGEFQWALELSERVKYLGKDCLTLAREVKIKALRGLAVKEYNAPNRNYYLSYARELESGDLENIWN